MLSLAFNLELKYTEVALSVRLLANQEEFLNWIIYSNNSFAFSFNEIIWYSGGYVRRMKHKNEKKIAIQVFYVLDYNFYGEYWRNIG